MRSCFACERSLVNGSATFRAVCILQIFYVYNTLHGATLAKCSHFQYVSRSRLRVIQIGVKACIDVTFYDVIFITSIIEKYFLSLLRIILTNVQWSTPRSLLYSLYENSVGYTIDLVYNMAYFIEPMAEAVTPRFDRTLIMHANVYDQDQGLTGRYHNTTLKHK